jgi:DNA-binding CsgD family transcriptional regulator
VPNRIHSYCAPTRNSRRSTDRNPVNPRPHIGLNIAVRGEQVALPPGATDKCPFLRMLVAEMGARDVFDGLQLILEQGRAKQLSSPAGLADLTKRECDVLSQVARGLTNQEIAINLNLTLPTVKSYMTHVMEKLHVRNRVEAVLEYRRRGGPLDNNQHARREI